MNARGILLNELDAIEDVLGADFAGMWPVEEQEKVRHAIQGAASGKTTSMEGFCPTAKGAPRWWETRFAPMPSPIGGPHWVVGISRDITLRRQTELALSEDQDKRGRRSAAEHEQLGQLFDQAPTFMAMLRGPDHRIEMANPPYMKLIGHRTVIGKTVAEALPDAVEQGYLKLLDSVFASGKPFTARGATYAMQSEPGASLDERIVDFVFQPIKAASGAIVGIFVEGTDVTERARADLILRASEARLREQKARLERQVIERTQARLVTWQVSPDLLGALNADGYFETSNPAWQAVLGWSEAEVASQSIFELLHPDDLERTRVGFALTQIGQPAIRFPNRYRCKDGSYRWISWVGVLDHLLVYCSGRDVTDERAAEEKLANAQDAIRQLQKVEAIGQLTAGLAHDFNNLLTIILLNLDCLAQRMMVGSEDWSLAQNAITAAQQGADLTKALLAYARRQPLAPVRTDLTKTVKSTAQLLHRTLGEDLTIEVKLGEYLWPVLVDIPQLESAILNLAINARDAMKRGGKLTIAARNVTIVSEEVDVFDGLQGDFLVISVSDTGSGMSPQVIAKAFDAFFTTKGANGTGLGLSMVHAFIKQMGGEVKIESQMGEGTTVSLYLPRSHVSELVENEKEAKSLTSAVGSEMILVVEDNEDLRRLTVFLLKRLGYRTIDVAFATSALDIIKSDVPIDLLFTDVAMKGAIDGWALALMSRELRKDLPVLFTSGNASLGFESSQEVWGNLLPKPYRKDQLTHSVRTSIDGAS